MDGQTPDPQPQSSPQPVGNPVPDVPAGRYLCRIDSARYDANEKRQRGYLFLGLRIVGHEGYGGELSKTIAINLDGSNLGHVKIALESLGWTWPLSDLQWFCDRLLYRHCWADWGPDRNGNWWVNPDVSIGVVPWDQVPDPPVMTMPDVDLTPPPDDGPRDNEPIH